MFHHLEHFVEKEKGGNHLVQGLVNMVDGAQPTNVNPIFFCMILAECNLELSWKSIFFPHHSHSITLLTWSYPPWNRLQRFILVNSLPFAWNILIKTYFPSPALIFLRNKLFLWLEKRLVDMDMGSSVFFWEDEETKCSACSLFLSFSNGSKLWIGICWSGFFV